MTAQNALLLALDTDLQNIARTAHAIARNLYKGNAEQLRAWASASHVERDPNHPGIAPAPAPTPAAAAVPAK